MADETKRRIEMIEIQAPVNVFSTYSHKGSRGLPCAMVTSPRTLVAWGTERRKSILSASAPFRPHQRTPRIRVERFERHSSEAAMS